MITLHQKQSKFVELVAKLIQFCYSSGYELSFGECYRTPEQARLNSLSGSGIANSLHTLRLAIDLNLFKDGKWLNRSEDFLPLGEWWEKQSTPEFECSWGGRFQHPDGNHFSISHNGVK